MTGSITLLYGGLCTVLLFALGLRVSMARGKEKTFVGDPPSRWLTAQIRAHGNAAEWIPTTLVMLLVLELSGAHPTALRAFGGAFFLGRLLHATGVAFGRGGLAPMGMSLSYLTTLSLGVWAVVRHFAG